MMALCDIARPSPELFVPGRGDTRAGTSRVPQKGSPAQPNEADTMDARRGMPGVSEEQANLTLDTLSFLFWALAIYLFLEHYSAKISNHCASNMVEGLSGQWFPNTSVLCQLAGEM